MVLFYFFQSLNSVGFCPHPVNQRRGECENRDPPHYNLALLWFILWYHTLNSAQSSKRMVRRIVGPSEKNPPKIKLKSTVRPRDTLPQAARILQVHVFELGPKEFELNKFM